MASSKPVLQKNKYLKHGPSPRKTPSPATKVDPHLPLADVDGDERPAIPDAVDAAAQNFRRQLEEVSAENLESTVGGLKLIC